MAASPKVQISLRLPEDLLKQVDARAELDAISRSAVLKMAVTAWLDTQPGLTLGSTSRMPQDVLEARRELFNLLKNRALQTKHRITINRLVIRSFANAASVQKKVIDGIHIELVDTLWLLRACVETRVQAVTMRPLLKTDLKHADRKVYDQIFSTYIRLLDLERADAVGAAALAATNRIIEEIRNLL